MAQSKPFLAPQAGTVFWLWLLSAAAAAIVAAAGYYLLGEVDSIPVVCASLIVMEIAQSIVLHRYAPQRARWYEWLLPGAAGLFAAIPLALIIDAFSEAGGGLNPETDVRGCLVAGAGISAFVFGLIQNGNSKYSVVWGFIYAAAAIMAALAGGLVGFSVYHAANRPDDYSVSEAARATGIAAGFLLGIVVYGALTGLAIALSLRFEAPYGEEHRQIAR